MISLTAERKGRREVRNCLNQDACSWNMPLAIKEVNNFMSMTDKKPEFLHAA